MAKSKTQAEYVLTGVNLPREALDILRQAAVHRAEIDGTRVSVSGVLRDLIFASREILERRP